MFGQCTVLRHLRAGSDAEDEVVALMQYMEIMTLLIDVDKASRCVIVKLFLPHNIDRNVKEAFSNEDMKDLGRNNYSIWSPIALQQRLSFVIY